MSSDYVLFLTTFKDKQEAGRISKILLEKKKIACANIIDSISSHFLWKGKIDSEEEALMIGKTKQSAVEEVEKIIKEEHSYDVPEFIVIPIVGGSSEYLNWVEETVV